MLANYIGIALSSAAFLATVFYILKDIRELERRIEATKLGHLVSNELLEASYQANIAAEWRG